MESGKALSAVAARRARQGVQLLDVEATSSPQDSASNSILTRQSEHVGHLNRASIPSRSKKKRKRDKADIKTFDLDLPAEQGIAITTDLLHPRPQKIHKPGDTEVQQQDDRVNDMETILDSNLTDYSEPENQTPGSRETISRSLSDIGELSRVDHTKGDRATVCLRDHERLVVIGQYDIWVKKGSIQVLGSLIHASSRLYRVYASASHALPVIHHAKSPYGPLHQDAHFDLFSCRLGLRSLHRLSPKFAKLWNDNRDRSGKSFKILHHTFDDRYQRPLRPFEPPTDWQERAVTLSGREGNEPSAIMMCGPKGAGKSSFGKLLANSYLSRKASSCGIAFLDLDPGQPEFTPPGQVTLIHIRDFNLGLPFTNVLENGRSQDLIVRSHYIGHTSPKEDVNHYTTCARDLHAQYRKLLKRKGCPLIVNSCGWIQSSGLEILEAFTKDFGLTDVVYMSTVGPPEVIETLTDVCNQQFAYLHLLPSQEAKPPLRIAQDLRLMQTMSYFHIKDMKTSLVHSDPTPLHVLRPRILKLSGKNQDVLAIMILGEEKSPKNLQYLVNGRTLALVAIEDHKALPPSVIQGAEGSVNQALLESSMNGTGTEEVDFYDAKDAPFFAEVAANERAELDLSFSQGLRGRRTPPIRWSPEGLPYLYYGTHANIPLDPTKSHTIGQVLVRGIGASGNLEVLTPVPNDVLDSLSSNRTPLVLVGGSIEAPSWSYLEEYYEARASKRDYKRWKRFCEKHEAHNEDDSDSPDEFDVGEYVARTPWVGFAHSETRTGSKGNRMWKVRRNMTTADRRRNVD